jgi:hypothetical protein
MSKSVAGEPVVCAECRFNPVEVEGEALCRFCARAAAAPRQAETAPVWRYIVGAYDSGLDPNTVEGRRLAAYWAKRKAGG